MLWRGITYDCKKNKVTAMVFLAKLAYNSKKLITTLKSSIAQLTEVVGVQVLPGVRANNYWDNFRSFSHQNRLSSGSVTNPVIAQVLLTVSVFCGDYTFCQPSTMRTILSIFSPVVYKEFHKKLHSVLR
jgi:hypothetical protein